MSNLLSLLSQYTLLTGTAKYLSTLDIFHLALANSECYGIILQSAPVFNRLKLTALCDGTGLTARQEFRGPYALGPKDFTWGRTGRRPHYDEELEVRVWNLKCDAANALPCLSCGINVCEECRYVPRVRDTKRGSHRRPHNEPTASSYNVICYCTACDESVEADLPLSLSEYCDCDRYTRWICLKCKGREEKISGLYYQKRTKGFWADPDLEEGMCLHNHQSRLAFWCPCGKRPPVDGHVRCAWCKRRHNLDTWMDENPTYIPAFDEDPSQPTRQLAW
ncbi:uncharacterized protein PAC_18983 [Phialocephala subalpina]|uniref:Uncharacterized protein n=1 Tax=Phialocephala subalpina TaxID=576137 RepID=A0A1L7XVK5_9HELO|nr:uncharacterized protein PAC_18983 [Phialocephala subalpina]